MGNRAAAHRAIYTREISESSHIPKLTWPPGSPDLNPIENIWHILKNMLNKRPPHPTTKEQSKRAIVNEWGRVSEVELLELMD